MASNDNNAPDQFELPPRPILNFVPPPTVLTQGIECLAVQFSPCARFAVLVWDSRNPDDFVAVDTDFSVPPETLADPRTKPPPDTSELLLHSHVALYDVSFDSRCELISSRSSTNSNALGAGAPSLLPFASKEIVVKRPSPPPVLTVREESDAIIVSVTMSHVVKLEIEPRHFLFTEPEDYRRRAQAQVPQVRVFSWSIPKGHMNRINVALSTSLFTPTLKTTRSGRLRPDPTLKDALEAPVSDRFVCKLQSRPSTTQPDGRTGTSFLLDYDNENVAEDLPPQIRPGATIRFQNWPGLAGPAIVMFTQRSMVVGELSLTSGQADKAWTDVRFPESIVCDASREFVSVASNGVEGVFWNGAVCWFRIDELSETGSDSVAFTTQLSPGRPEALAITSDGRFVIGVHRERSTAERSIWIAELKKCLASSDECYTSYPLDGGVCSGQAVADPQPIKFSWHRRVALQCCIGAPVVTVTHGPYVSVFAIDESGDLPGLREVRRFWRAHSASSILPDAQGIVFVGPKNPEGFMTLFEIEAVESKSANKG